MLNMALTKKLLASLCTTVIVCGQVDARQPRSAAAKYQFQKANPCPVTGARRGKCADHVIDHVIPLCAGGEDTPVNMQWQTIREAKRKDIDEARECRALRKSERRR